MTAIITKQNAIDRAFINGGGGSGGDGEFDTLHVKGTATFDGEVIFNRADEHKFTIDEIKSDIENHEERITALEEGGSGGGFNIEEGYEYFHVKNEDVTISHSDSSSTRLNIHLPENLISQIKERKPTTDLFKLTFRKRNLYTVEGELINSLVISIVDGVIQNILFEEHALPSTFAFVEPGDYNTYFTITSEPSPDNIPSITCINTQINPYTDFINGDLTIAYLLPQSTLSTTNDVKCNIINAKNALQLRESNVLYFYKPSAITESEQHFSITFNIPADYIIPKGLNFIFNEYCFSNSWCLTWDGDKWVGNNIQGSLQASTTHKFTNPSIPIGFHNDVMKYFGIYVKHNEFNYLAIQKISPTITRDENYALHLHDNGLIKWHFEMFDGSLMEYNPADFGSIGGMPFDKTEDYDVAAITHRWKEHYKPNWFELTGKIIIGNATTTIKYRKNSTEDYDAPNEYGQVNSFIHVSYPHLTLPTTSRV